MQLGAFAILFVVTVTSNEFSVRSKRGKYPRLVLWKKGLFSHPRSHFLTSNSEPNDGDRLLHAFKICCGAPSYLVEDMKVKCPKLVAFDVDDIVVPKLLFLRNSVLQSHTHNMHLLLDITLFPGYFGMSLEKVIAPRHAFAITRHAINCGQSLMLNQCCGLKRMILCTDEEYCAGRIPSI